ncbi:FkbM family methyltransferase [Paenibacillus taihuensis]|nr:FkbM family methyltransferase [Paenibacillus taihuensis]
MSNPRIELEDGSIIIGHDNEYISTVLNNSKQYYEINELRKFSRYVPENPVVYDIGSNIGNHTIYFHKHYHAKKIYAFEPAAENVALLELNIKNNNLQNVEVFQAAAGSAAKKADLTRNTNNMGECRLVENSEGAVKVVSIDEIKLDAPDFVKIDVEGSELDVLNGMSRLLTESSPVIWIEINENFSDVHLVLNQLQYELVDKHHFNHIYLKCKDQAEQVETMSTFRANIVPEYNHAILDKWNLNKWLNAEKEKVKVKEQEKSECLIQINRIQNDFENLQLRYSHLEQEKKDLDIDIDKLTKTLVDLKNETQELTHSYETEKQVMLKNTADLKTSVGALQFRLINTSLMYENEKKDIQMQLLQHIDAERKALLELISLKQHYQLIEARYMRLRNTLPGKVAVKLWKFAKRLKQKRDSIG